MQNNPHAMNDLISISRRYGADPAFVLAGGGNTSFKHGNRLWVKASGHALATIGADGFVELDRDSLQGMLVSDWPQDPKVREAQFIQWVMNARIQPELQQRPSVEALIHHLLPDDFVVHTHPGIVNALTCCVDGKRLAAELFGDEVLWQDYVDPGVILAQHLDRSIAQHRKRTGRPPSGILLANHGLIVSGQSAVEIESRSERIFGKIGECLKSKSPAWSAVDFSPRSELLTMYAQAMGRLMPDRHVISDSSQSICKLVASMPGRDAALAGPLTPDQIVYCRSIPLWIENPSPDSSIAQRQWKEALEQYVSVCGFDAWVGLVAGTGMIVFRDSPKLAEITVSIYRDAAAVYHNAARLGGVNVLGRRDQQFIEQWEVEAYRRSVISKTASVTAS